MAGSAIDGKRSMPEEQTITSSIAAPLQTHPYKHMPNLSRKAHQAASVHCWEKMHISEYQKQAL